ncbi:heterokaryon incompatibility protein-domain-containing protein [Immersiella caudata]|uniref:Heterokaryon incompatibility protein-domain-containing protein n=1 Tax=Immersiella caudata TaxID=314043 RepID=A0AA39WQD2_9PEZI|nr:heterokaryon incompatibility protein-domain-containing protein [Immersiella caudata]
MNLVPPHYTYARLPSPLARTIRLIRVLPSPDPLARVSIEIETHPLSSTPPYDAISYVWGEPDDSETVPFVTCSDESILKVTPNLHWALRRVRGTGGDPVSVWADAICINQNDDEERSAQVAFMGEIYASARRVLVCMGDAPTRGAEKEVAKLVEAVKLFRDSELGLDHACGEHDRLRRLRSSLQEADRSWEALSEVMLRPWFTRVWVIQEVGLAREPVVLYGTEEFGYRDLVRTADWANGQISLLRYRIQTWRIHVEWMEWSRPNAPPERTLWNLLDHASLLTCRDPRDRIYALLGHPVARTEGGRRPLFIPDYTRPLNGLYVEVTEALLRMVGLKTLVSVEHTPESLEDGCPSWVIRWHIQAKFNDISGSSMVIFDAGGQADPAHPARINGPRLRLWGRMVDKVSSCFEFRFFVAASCALGFRDAQDRRRRFETRQFIDFLVPESTSSRGREDVQLAFIDTVCAGRVGGDRRERLRCFFLLLALLDQEFSGSSRDWSDPADIDVLSDPDAVGAADLWDTIDLYASGRVFAVTVEGKFALLPQVSQPGDEICIIRGLDVPVVTRLSGDGASHILLGEAYVNGIMDGEALHVAGEEDSELVIC